jgi:hypothetical protein
MVSAGVLALPRTTAHAADSSTSSAVTVAGTGEFSALKVTASQTKQLTNEVITVSWSGGQQTLPASGDEFDANFLQLMQCWGDESGGPKPEQCQFGTGSGNFGTFPAAPNVLTRALEPADPLEKAAGVTAETYMPFVAPDGRSTPGEYRNLGAAFSAHETNEIDVARTLPDGTGKVKFEVQTGLESAALGCGLTIGGATHSCWLVVVPRSRAEVDGHVVDGTNRDRLNSSPLSATNWKNRIVIPLAFEPVGTQCSIGHAELPVAGSELLAAAMLRWQAGSCATGGRNISYELQSDGQARASLSSQHPELRAVSAVVALPAGAPPSVYAPIGVTGTTLAFLVERQPAITASAAARARAGQLIDTVRITPRILAKMLTQSYGSYTWDASAVSGNPTDPSHDPDFLQFNPEFADQQLIIRSPLESALSSDAAYQLWQYVVADKDARDFLAGHDDQWHMHLNSHYRGVGLPDFSFPRADTTCVNVLIFYPNQTARCSLERAPFAGNMAAAARNVFRGELQGHNFWDNARVPAGYTGDGTQQIGTRSMSAVVDVPSAVRYGLVMAELRTPSGSFVAPSATSMAAATSAMKPGPVAGTKVLDEATVPADAYPLTAFTYAVTAPGHLSAEDSQGYANFIRYIATRGQSSGFAPTDLPLGYVPLPAAEVQLAQRVADTIAANKPGAVTPASTAPSTSGGNPSSSPSVSLVGGETGNPGSLSPTPASTTTPSAPSRVSATPTVTPSTSANTGTPPQAAPVRLVSTPAQPLGATRYGAVLALILGGAALLLRGALPWFGRRPTG